MFVCEFLLNLGVSKLVYTMGACPSAVSNKEFNKYQLNTYRPNLTQTNNTFLWTTNEIGSRLLIVTNETMELIELWNEKRRSNMDHEEERSNLWRTLYSVPLPTGLTKNVQQEGGRERGKSDII